MKLIEALEVTQKRPAGTRRESVYLACGFTPLHLRTFLNAHLELQGPETTVDITVGSFGDLPGNLRRACAGPFDSAAVILEWPDLDPRLGFRRLGGWQPRLFGDVLASVRNTRAALQDLLLQLSRVCPVALCLPTLPLAPIAHTPGWEASKLELELRSEVNALAMWAAEIPPIRVLNSQRLDHLSPPGERIDLKSELLAGFPYTQRHAEAIASLLAHLMRTPQPKKGLITDLDDTLWRGLLGEDGVRGISWEMASGSHIHGLYQQLLAALAESGVLLAAASRNDRALVDLAFERSDLLLHRDQIFPFEVHWESKVLSVDRILRSWNVAADSVVFVDDSPMEIAEVQAAYPAIECVLFPKHDPPATHCLLNHLRDLFGKRSLLEEDRYRMQSLRNSEIVRHAVEQGAQSLESLLAQANAEIRVRFSDEPDQPRALELVNKTNQFNLNGKRYTSAEWQRYFYRSGAFLMSVEYKDKFGSLGCVAVVLGRAESHRLQLDTWVLSCRAFSRRIEHQCLRILLDHFQVHELVLAFHSTPRNGPLEEFLATFGTPQASFQIERSALDAACPPLYHSVIKEDTPRYEVTHG